MIYECVYFLISLPISTPLLMIMAVFCYRSADRNHNCENTTAAFLNPCVISFSVINQIIIFPDISMKTGDNLINFMTNFVSKVQLINSKLLKVTTNFM